MTEPQTILIVEDEDKIASLQSDYLEKIGGYHTHIVNRGDEALAVFEQMIFQAGDSMRHIILA